MLAPRPVPVRWLAVAAVAGCIAGLAVGVALRVPTRGGLPAGPPTAAMAPLTPLPPPTPAAAPAALDPARTVRYVVQRGDSPWRIAAALTGSGNRWGELWPGQERPVVRVGQALDLQVHAVPTARRE